MYSIYIIKNSINQKIYIGKTYNPQKRWNYHKSASNYLNAKYKNKHLYNAMRKYGVENFFFSVLESCEKEKIDLLETRYIILFRGFDPKFGYNKSLGGEGGDTFSHRREDLKEITRTRLSKYMKENKHGISLLSKKGVHITESSPEIKETWQKNFKKSMKKLSERRSAGKFTEKELKFYQKIKKDRMGKGNPMYKGSYYIYSPEGELYGVYDSLRIAVRETGFPYSTLNKCVLNKTSPQCGRWRGFTAIRKEF